MTYVYTFLGKIKIIQVCEKGTNEDHFLCNFSITQYSDI